MPVLLGGVTLLGLAVGSFLNVVIHRVPQGGSLVRPGSSCPACGCAVRSRHNIPVLSWLVLGGRCADCREPISIRYPVVELLTAALFVMVTARAAALDQVAVLPALLWFTAAGVALAAIDLEVRRLPDAIVLPSYAVLAVLLAVAAVVDRDPAALLRAAACATAACLAFYAIAVANPVGMGFGDVKLAGIVGGVLGYLSWSAVVVAIAAAFLLGTVVALAGLLTRRVNRTTLLPFGPFVVAGALLAVLGAAPITAASTDLVRGPVSGTTPSTPGRTP